ncbi:MAG: YGGT family protein [Peptococcaceae bacterium BICA1-7]|nr:MAG: YGGT family protein [Peptococcaceae bacterium BICA1-7]HBV98965.1 YggT family protein [Desulfotomaculum sp.]
MGLIKTLIDVAFEVYIVLIIANVLLSLLRINPYQPVVRFIYEITEPVLGLFRKVIPPIGVLDISPLVAILALQVLQYLIDSILVAISRMLG